MFIFALPLIFLPGLAKGLPLDSQADTRKENSSVTIFDANFLKTELPYKKFDDNFETATDKIPLDDSEIDELNDYITHVKASATVVLKHLERTITTQNRTEKNMTKVVKELLDVFGTKIQNHSKEVAAIEKKYGMDTEYTFFDIQETAGRLIYNQQMILLNKTVNTTKPVRRREMQIAVYSHTVEFLGEERRYLCNTYGFCKPQSFFTNYFGHFIHEILSLPFEKFKIIVKFLMTVVEQCDEFWDMISEMDIDEKSALMVRKLYDDPERVKEILTELRAILRHRFLIVRTKDYEHSTRVQAVRMILNIIDESFYSQVDGKLLNNINNMSKIIKKWARSNDEEPPFNEIDLVEFVNKIIKIFNFNPDDRKEDIIKIILKGSSGSVKMSELTFRNGFAGVYYTAESKSKENKGNSTNMGKSDNMGITANIGITGDKGNAVGMGKIAIIGNTDKKAQ
ncbi:uncharacterized protein LOC142982221 [Anticarsia gemmatalis]|uniref:uncharacterized protein LOC142982221 n=1 Tax=Anticarsia gemmatalis TaxID=129554 RepID=UPI003F768134